MGNETPGYLKNFFFWLQKYRLWRIIYVIKSVKYSWNCELLSFITNLRNLNFLSSSKLSTRSSMKCLYLNVSFFIQNIFKHFFLCFSSKNYMPKGFFLNFHFKLKFTSVTLCKVFLYSNKFSGQNCTKITFEWILLCQI